MNKEQLPFAGRPTRLVDEPIFDPSKHLALESPEDTFRFVICQLESDSTSAFRILDTLRRCVTSVTRFTKSATQAGKKSYARG